MKPKIYSRFNPPLVSGLTCVKPSLTSQEFKEECNINVLLKKYAVQAKFLGIPLSEVIPQPTADNFGDFTNVEEFQQSMNRVSEIKGLFDALPSDIRQQCGNDPANFLRMCQDDKNFKDFAARGIFNKEEVNEYFNQISKLAESNSQGNLESSASVEKGQGTAEVKTAENSAV